MVQNGRSPAKAGTGLRNSDLNTQKMCGSSAALPFLKSLLFERVEIGVSEQRFQKGRHSQESPAWLS